MDRRIDYSITAEIFHINRQKKGNKRENIKKKTFIAALN